MKNNNLYSKEVLKVLPNPIGNLTQEQRLEKFKQRFESLYTSRYCSLTFEWFCELVKEITHKEKLSSRVPIEDQIKVSDYIMKETIARLEESITPPIAPGDGEEAFLLNMERFRVIGNRNIYGNTCTVFYPPSGYSYNDEVSNVYHHMYTGVLQSSAALALLASVGEFTKDYILGGGPKSMIEWMVFVATAASVAEAAFEFVNIPSDPEAFTSHEPTLTYLSNQANQSALTVAYIFGK